MRILFIGGGTGGHFFPIIAIARELKKIAEQEKVLSLEMYFMGPKNKDFKKILEEEEIFYIPVLTGKFRRYASAKNILDIPKIIIGIMQGVWNMLILMPDAVLCKGGYGSFPGLIGAVVFRIPLIVHESDAVPGKVNILAKRFADRIGVSFASAVKFFPKEKTALTGTPIRKRVLGGNIQEAKRELQIFSQLPVIGIYGGSQGAQIINNTILEILPQLTAKYEVVHQIGQKNFEHIVQEAGVVLTQENKDHYHPVAFLGENGVRNFLNASDLIISRAGSSAIFEIAAAGKPSILIPLLHAAQDHQRKNAYEYAAKGGAVVIEETNLTPHILLVEIEKIMNSSEIRQSMIKSAQQFARIDSAEIIARELIKLALH